MCSYLVRCRLLFLLVGLQQCVHAFTRIPTQSTHTLLNSIDDRLRNLDQQLRNYRHANPVVDQLQHVRRLDVLEARIERFEATLTARLDRVDGNMSLQYFKDDIANDQLLRKIDAVYERMHHKMFHIEMKIDTGERRILEKLDAIMLRQEQQFGGDPLPSAAAAAVASTQRKSSDVDEAIGEVFDAVDEMKVSVNAALESVAKSLQHDVARLQASVDAVALNCTALAMQSPPTDDASIQRLESILNATRYEQQNAMRSVVVQVGRLEGKNNAALGCSDADGGDATATCRHINDKFDKLMAQQAMFLDSCHRIQSDEPQLESKISEILEKIVDVFEKESAIELKDIRNIEQLIQTHDGAVRRSLYTTSHNMAVLLQKGKEHKDELAAQVTAIRDAVSDLSRRLEDAAANHTTPLELTQVLTTLHEVRDDLSRQANHSISSDKDRTALHDDVRLLISMLRARNQSLDIATLTAGVRSVSEKIDAFFANYTSNTIYERIERLLMQQNSNRTHTQTTHAESDAGLDEAIREIFGQTPDDVDQAISAIFGQRPNATNTTATVVTPAATDDADDDAGEIIFAEVNCASGLLDVRHATPINCANCTPPSSPLPCAVPAIDNATTNCSSCDGGANVAKDDDVPPLIELDIDVRGDMQSLRPQNSSKTNMIDDDSNPTIQSAEDNTSLPGSSTTTK